jgi:hypothetical protein
MSMGRAPEGIPGLGVSSLGVLGIGIRYLCLEGLSRGTISDFADDDSARGESIGYRRLGSEITILTMTL